MRDRTSSASSDISTTGSPLTISLVGGLGRVNISLKTVDEEASTDLWTGKLARSDVRTMMSASLVSRHSGRGKGVAGEPR